MNNTLYYQYFISLLYTYTLIGVAFVFFGVYKNSKVVTFFGMGILFFCLLKTILM